VQIRGPRRWVEPATETGVSDVKLDAAEIAEIIRRAATSWRSRQKYRKSKSTHRPAVATCPLALRFQLPPFRDLQRFRFCRYAGRAIDGFSRGPSKRAIQFAVFGSCQSEAIKATF
jgi:hypothetical protein